MRDIGSGGREFIFLEREFLEELTGHAGTSLFLVNSDAFGDDSLPRRVGGGRCLLAG